MDLIIHNTAVLRSQHVLCMDHKIYCLKKKDESRNDEIERFFRWCAVSWLSRAYLHTSVSLLFFSFFLNLWYSCLLFYLWENQQQSLCSVQKVTLRWIHGARVRQGYQSPCPSSHGTTWHMGVRVNHEHDARFLWLMTRSDWFVEGSEWAEQGTGLILTLWWKVREEINVLWR